jgi:hypothetical protein
MCISEVHVVVARSMNFKAHHTIELHVSHTDAPRGRYLRLSLVLS